MVLALDHADHKIHTRIHVQKNETVNQRIAFFDFDGTITTHDTLLEFIRFSKGAFLFYLGFLLYSPWLVAYRLKIIPNQLAKEKILGFFFANTPLADFQSQCDRFAVEILPTLLRPKALAEIARLQQAGFVVAVVSASPENWIAGWAAANGLLLIATRLDIKEQQLTGRIAGRNCHGKEKVNRIHETFQLTDYKEIYAYGDSSGDRPMLALASISFFKPFR